MFEFVVLTPYKALFLEALLTPRPHRAPPSSSHPRGPQIPLLKKGGKARRRQRQPGTATRRCEVATAAPSGPRGGRRLPPTPTRHPRTHSLGCRLLPPRRGSARRPPRAPAPRPPPPLSPRAATTAASRPGSDGGGAALLCGWAAGARGHRPGGLPGPSPPAPSAGLARRLLPRSAALAPAAASRPLARSLPPSAGPPRVVA